MNRIITIFSFLFLFTSGYSQISFEQNAIDLGIEDSFGVHILGGGGVVFYDFNNDGWDDITMATSEGDSINFYINEEGSFVKIQPSLVNNTAQVKNILWGDYDNDGDPDLFVTGYQTGNNLYENQGDLTFIDVTVDAGLTTDSMGFQGASWGDINNDGFLDLYITTNDNATFETNFLYTNNGDGTFTDITVSAGVTDSVKAPFGLVFSDIDSDGDQDMYLSIDHHLANSVFVNNGDDTFLDDTENCGGGFEMFSMCIAAGDYDNDGNEDFYFSNMTPEGSKLAKSNGSGNFAEMSEDAGVNWLGNGWGAAWLDADLDGDLDLYACGCNNILDGYESSIFYKNDGDATFSSLPLCGFENDTVRSYSVAIGDIDNDGYPDIVVNNEEGYTLSIWQNTSVNENHYLKVQLQGITNNADGIGSWVEVYNDGEMQRHYTHSANGYLSQNSQYEIFGLGANETADSVKVIWLNGLVDIAYNVEADQKITFVEGMGATGIENNVLHSFNLYPNPGSTSINVDLSTSFPSINRVDVYSVEGKLIKSKTSIDLNERFSLDVNDFPNGLYLMNIVTSDGMYSEMFSVQH